MKVTYLFALLIIPFIGISQTYIAHRGASYLAPENTLASVNLAWKLDAEMVEIDIHLSWDNQVMVHHDKNTKKITDEDYKIKETDSKILRTLDAGIYKSEKYKGEKIPFLKEIIETIPVNKTLVVEIKCDFEVIPYLEKLVNESGKKEQIVFISFGWETILETKNTFPNNKCYWLSAIRPGLKSRMNKASEIGLDGINLRYSLINENIMKLANDLGLEVLCWTVDDPAEAKRLIDLGVSGITTNRPAWLKQQVEKL